MINPNWQRWIKASVVKNFENPDIPMTADGDDRNPVEKDFIEVRMDGPRFYSDGRDKYRIWLAINVVVQSVMGKDTYNHERNIGHAQVLFKDNIPVYKYGDDNELLGCLRLIDNGINGEFLRTNNLGQIEKTYRLQQATIEGHYRMELSNGTN